MGEQDREKREKNGQEIMEKNGQEFTEKNEQEIMERIRQSQEQILVPDSLSPENIKKKLDESIAAAKNAEGKSTAASKGTEEKSAAEHAVEHVGKNVGEHAGENAGEHAGESAGQGSGKIVPIKKWRKTVLRIAKTAAAALVIFAAGHQIGAVQMRRTLLPVQSDQSLQMETELTHENNTEAAQQSVQENAEAGVQMAKMETGIQIAETEPAAQEDSAISTMPLKQELFTVPQSEAAVDQADTDEPAVNEAAADQAEAGTAVSEAAAPVKKTARADLAAADQEDTAEAAADETAPDQAEGIAPVGSAEELYNRLVEFQNQNGYDMGVNVKYQAMAIAEDASFEVAAENAPVAAGAGAESGSYSSTNLRQLGVDESDIVKTDGKYIYILKRNSSVKIISAEGEELALIQSLVPEDLSVSVRDMYVDGDTLNVITSGSKTAMLEEEPDVYTTQDYDFAQVWTYDIADRKAPKLLGCAEQEGYYHSSRKVGDYIYLFTQFQPKIGNSAERGIMPLVNGTAMPVSDIYLPKTLQSTSYLVIGSVNVKDPGRTVSHKAVVSGVNHFYVSTESIFICNQSWENGKDVTEILKFSYRDGEIRGVGACSLEGYLNDTFSLDEYNGYLRVVATDWNSGDEVNALYIYDENMNLTGKIGDIAPDETIRSARFLGDTGYFVTFRQTDPLFSVDLSDPADPRILGELKVTGFSSYLHYYGENRLLGIGYDADSGTGATTGIKLSMFDISDPANVTEVKRYIIKDADYCPGLSDYKSILIDPDKNLFGFVCDNKYLVFSYDEQEGFRNKLAYNMSEGSEKSNYWYEYEGVRGLYIGDTFYLANMDAVRAFDMADGFEQKTKLEI